MTQKIFNTYNQNYIDTTLGHAISYTLVNNVLTLNLLDKNGTAISTQTITLQGKLADVLYDDTSKVLTIKYADGTADKTYTLKNFITGSFGKVSSEVGKINLNIKDTATSADIINTTIEKVVFEQDAQTLTNKTINTNENTITKGTNANISTPLFGIVKADGVSITANDGVLSIIDSHDTYSMVKEETPTTGFIATYQLKRTLDGVTTNAGVKIDLPKNFLVKSATVKECTEDDKPEAGMKVGDKYIDFVVHTSEEPESQETHIYIQFKNLISAYTAGDGLKLDSDNKFSIELSESKSGLTLAGSVPGDKTLEVVTDNSSVEVSSDNKIQVKDSGVVTAKIADDNVTTAKLAPAVRMKIYNIEENEGVLTFTQLSDN